MRTTIFLVASVIQSNFSNVVKHITGFDIFDGNYNQPSMKKIMRTIMNIYKYSHPENIYFVIFCDMLLMTHTFSSYIIITRNRINDFSIQPYTLHPL